MAKESQRLEREFLSAIKEKTGKDLATWMSVIRAAGLDKPAAILAWLKKNYPLNHMQANFLAGIFLNGGKPVFDYEVLFARLFEGKEGLLPLYQALEKGIRKRLPDVEFIPTKSYVSIEARHVFGCAVLTKKSIRVGLDMGDTPFDGYLQPAKSLGAMPNLTHMIEIAAPADVDEPLLKAVQRAYTLTS